MPGMPQRATQMRSADREHIRAAWAWRISGCIPGMPAEVRSFRQGLAGLRACPRAAPALPLKDYLPGLPGTLAAQCGEPCCRGQMRRAEHDDDINCTPTTADDAVERLHGNYECTPPVLAVNNLSLVVCASCAAEDTFSEAIGNEVAAGWDGDCNGATVGGLCAPVAYAIPQRWTQPGHGCAMSGLAGESELRLDDRAERTLSGAGLIAA